MLIIVNETFQFVMNGWALYFDGKRLIAFYDMEEDPMLANNLIGKVPEPQQELLLMKAVIQQFNNRMIENKLTISN